MIRNKLMRWLQGPPATGALALLVLVLTVAIPAGIRAAIDGVIVGCEFTPYLPFVLLSAVLLRWWQAALVALAAVAILGGAFIGTHHEFGSACFLSGAGIFLASSAAMIFTMVAVRHIMWSLLVRGEDESAGGIVFSLDRGQVWASWYGQGPPVLLGSQRKVSEMMKDFIAQEEIGRRLNQSK